MPAGMEQVLALLVCVRLCDWTMCVRVCERERGGGVFIGLKWVPALHEYSVTPRVSTDVSLMSACVWENELPW